MTDKELTGEIDLLCAQAYLHAALSKVPPEAKPDVEWTASRTEHALELTREHSGEADSEVREEKADDV